MHILLVSWNYPPKVGGMEIMISQIVSGLRQTETVYVIGPPDADRGQMPEQNTHRPKRSGLLYFMGMALQKGWQLCRQQPVDVIVGGSALVLPVLYMLSWVSKRPFILIVHGLDLIYANPLYQVMIKMMLPRANQLIANSKNSKNLAIQRGVRSEKIKVIPPGVDFSIFALGKHSKMAQTKWQNRKIILSVGRLAKRKGIAEFVARCMPTIQQKCPEALFLIVGHNPTEALIHKEDVKGEIQSLIEANQLEEHVQLLGRVDEDLLISLYQQCQLFILPAIDVPGDVEGFGIVLMEAASVGKPVVSTRIGGISDAVVHGETGLLTSAGDWRGLETAVLQLLQNDQLSQKLGTQAQRRAEKSFDWPIVIDQYRKILKELSGEQKIL